MIPVIGREENVSVIQNPLVFQGLHNISHHVVNREKCLPS